MGSVRCKKITLLCFSSQCYRGESLIIIFYLALAKILKNFGFSQISVYYLSNERVRRVLVYDPHNRSEVWRFVTYMLLHTDSVHLGLNVIIQCILGTPLEFEQGHLRTAAIYIGGGLGGSLGASVFDAQSLMVGASGGVYALLISQIANIAFVSSITHIIYIIFLAVMDVYKDIIIDLLQNHGTMKYVAYRSLVVVVLAVADISYICYHIYIFNNERPRIGWAAHSAGALSGKFKKIYNISAARIPNRVSSPFLEVNVGRLSTRAIYFQNTYLLLCNV